MSNFVNVYRVSMAWWRAGVQLQPQAEMCLEQFIEDAFFDDDGRPFTETFDLLRRTALASQNDVDLAKTIFDKIAAREARRKTGPDYVWLTGWTRQQKHAFKLSDIPF